MVAQRVCKKQGENTGDYLKNIGNMVGKRSRSIALKNIIKARNFRLTAEGKKVFGGMQSLVNHAADLSSTLIWSCQHRVLEKAAAKDNKEVDDH